MTGKVEKRVRAILAAEVDNGFTIQDLCERVYGSSEKKHRVSVLRVVNRILDTEPAYARMTSERRGCTVIVYDCRNAHAYGMARLKAESFYRCEDDVIRRKLTEDAHRIVRGGAWWRFARMEWLTRSGEKPKELAALEAKQKKVLAALAASFAAKTRAK